MDHNGKKQIADATETWDVGDSVGLSSFTTIVRHPWARRLLTDSWFKHQLTGGCTRNDEPNGTCLYDTLDGAGRLRIYD